MPHVCLPRRNLRLRRPQPPPGPFNFCSLPLEIQKLILAPFFTHSCPIAPGATSPARRMLPVFHADTKLLTLSSQVNAIGSEILYGENTFYSGMPPGYFGSQAMQPAAFASMIGRKNASLVRSAVVSAKIARHKWEVLHLGGRDSIHEEMQEDGSWTRKTAAEHVCDMWTAERTAFDAAFRSLAVDEEVLASFGNLVSMTVTWNDGLAYRMTFDPKDVSERMRSLVLGVEVEGSSTRFIGEVAPLVMMNGNRARVYKEIWKLLHVTDLSVEEYSPNEASLDFFDNYDWYAALTIRRLFLE